MKKEKIFLIDMCKENLHSLEFVKPIEEVLKDEGKEYFVKKYKDVKESDFERCSKVIVSGTSLNDKDYLNYGEKFRFLRDFKKPVLGICAGAQIIALVFGEELIEGREIGIQEINFLKDFLGIKKEEKVYCLHKLSLKILKNFNIFSKTEISIQAFKHWKEEIYGVMFHPEVKNREMIVSFLK